jgi:uncharacterized protein YecT (DUF1311 family)
MKHPLRLLAALVLLGGAGSALAALPADCGALTTQSERAQCVFADFEHANADYAKAYADLRRGLPAAQRQRVLRMQKLWLDYRTAACDFEAGALQGGSLQSEVRWRCVARMTRERTAELARMAQCVEGDITCSSRTP